MLPARVAQTAVCKSLIAVSMRIATDSMRRLETASSDDNHSLGSSGFHEDCEVEEQEQRHRAQHGSRGMQSAPARE